MLQTIGKHIQGWIAGVVIAIVAAAFILLGLEYYINRSGQEGKPAATVNGIKISPEQVKNAYEALLQNYTRQGKTLNEQAQQQLQYMALEQLILDQVLLQTASKMGFIVSSQQVRQAIMQIPDFQENGKFSPEKFQQILNQNNIPPEMFFNKIQQTVLANQLLAGIQNSSFATSLEIEKVYGLLNQKRSFGYFILPVTHFMATAKPTEDKINEYYNAHKDEFVSPVQVKVAYLYLSPESLKSQVKLTPEKMRAYYEENKATFGGKSFEEAKPELEKRVSQHALGQLLAEKSEKLQQITYSNPQSLDQASQALGIPVKITDWMSNEGIPNDPLFSQAKVISAIFNDEVLQQKNNSFPIELNDGGVMVLRAAEVKSSQTKSLTEVKEEITKSLQKDAGQKEAGLQAYKIQHSLETGAKPETLANQFHLKWEEQNDASRDNKTIPPQLLGAVFKIAPNADPAKKTVTSVLLPDGNYAIILLKSLQNRDISQASMEEKEKIRTQLAGRLGELDYQLFTKSALDKSKVVIGEKNGH